MHQAAQLAHYAKDHNLGRLPDVFAPVMAGICVVYARPFLRADGLGPLNEKYARLTELKMQETHSDLIRNRLHFYAHRDFLKTRAVAPESGTAVDMHSVQLFFDGRGSYTFATQEPMYRDINLPDIIRGALPDASRARETSLIIHGRFLRSAKFSLQNGAIPRNAMQMLISRNT